MRLHYYYRLLGFLVVFVFAMSTNYLLERRGKCSDSPLQNPQAVEGAATGAAASAEVTADTQGVVLLEGPKIEPIKISAGEYPQSLKAEDLYKASKALDHLDELKVDVIMDAVNNDAYGIALSRNRK